MEEKKLFSIGEVAKLYHISVGNLRHYEKIGLLLPEYVDPGSGYRYYSVRQFECLNTIRYLRALDIPLAAIKSFLTDRDTARLHEILQKQQAAVQKKQKELDLISRKLASRMERLQAALDADMDTISVRQLPERRFALLKTSVVPDGYLGLERFLRQLDAASNSVFLGKVGLGLTPGSLREHRFSPYELVFLQLDEADAYSGQVTKAPAERCVTICFRGGHESAAAYYEKLLFHIEEQGLRISGFSKEITLIDYGFTNNESQFVTEIQIPVKEAP